jgi:MscS family membrane protein
MEAVADRNYVRASRYLNLNPAQKNTKTRARIVDNFRRLLDQGGSIYPSSFISDDLSGRTDDELEAGLDVVGNLTINDKEVNIYVENTQGTNSPPIWQVSAATVNVLAAVKPLNNGGGILDQVLPSYLEERMVSGVPLGHWLVMLLLIAIAYGVSWSIISGIHFVIRTVWKKAKTEHVDGIVRALELPFRLYLAVWIFVILSQQIGLSIIVRQRLSGITIVIGFVAFLILLWRLTDFISAYSVKRMTIRGRVSTLSVILFLRRAAKVAIVVIGVIAVLSTIGFDVTTGLAALGIGGIALALGAQKTIENFVGSVTLIADQPIRVGDFCAVGSTTGTVEQIGMRSTRLRTNNRTVVTIPNGEFSSTRIENFAHRDKFLFETVLDLRCETTPNQVRYLLVELRSLLYSHSMVLPDPARVRFTGLGTSSLKIEIYAYIDTVVYDTFLEIQEDLLLRIMDIVASSGTDFAFPSQTIYFAQDNGISEEKTKEAEDKVAEWKAQGDIPIPSFDPERIAKLKGTIAYPSEGSSSHKNKDGQLTIDSQMDT